MVFLIIIFNLKNLRLSENIRKKLYKVLLNIYTIILSANWIENFLLKKIELDNIYKW